MIRKISFRIYTIGFLLGVFFFFFAQSAVFSQEKTGARVPIEVTGDSVQFMNEEQLMVAEGHVVVKYQDATLTCDQAKVYMLQKKAIAQGNVILISKDQLLKGEKIDYNFGNKTGEVIEIEGWSKPVHFGTEKATKLSEKEYIIQNGFVSSSDLTPPEYQFKAKKVRYYPDDRVIIEHAVLYIYNMPVLYIPSYTYFLDKYRQQPQISISPGHNDEWGYYALTSYRYKVHALLDGTLRFDTRTKRGLAAGIDNYYDTKGMGKGYVKYYDIDDWQKNKDQIDRHTKNKFRIQARHRWDVTEKDTLIAEVHKAKGKKMIKDFFYRPEYEKDNAPPSYLYGVHADENYYATLVVQERLNTYEKVTERLPEAGLFIKEQRIGLGDIFYRGNFLLSNFSNKDPYKLNRTDVVRFDTMHLFSCPLKLANIFTLTPFSSIQGDLYNRLQDDGARMRGIFSTGTDLSVNMYGYAPSFKSNFLGMQMNGLRHVISPTIEYLYRAPSTVAEPKIIVSDYLDKLTMENKFTLGLVNKLQTKRYTHKDSTALGTVDFIRYFIGTEYWVRGEGRGHFKDILSETEFRPWPWLSMAVDTRYNRAAGKFDVVNLDLISEDREKWRICIGHTYERKASSRFRGDLWYKLNPKWALRVYENFEFDNNHFMEQQFSIQRDMHSWIAEVGCNLDGPYGKMVYFMFTLKAFPEIPFSFRTEVPSREKLLRR